MERPLLLSRRLQATSPDSGDTAWVLASTALVALMVPALAFFYGGLVSQRAVVNTMLLSFICFVTISLVWSLIGYSLAFGPNPDPAADGWIGGDSFGAYDSSDKVRIGTAIPEHAYFVFQLMFATITAAVISGSVVQRITLWAWTAFSVVWCMLVYVPLARWIFYSGGWLYTWGVLDFAGGLVVETASGVSAFVLAYWLGPGIAQKGSAHNIPFVLLGVGLLWVGWYGFNGGSALSSGYLSSRALTNTHLAACAGMATWTLIEVILPKLSAAVYECNRSKRRRSGSATSGASWFGGTRKQQALEEASTSPAVTSEGAGGAATPLPSPTSSVSIDSESAGVLAASSSVGKTQKAVVPVRAPVVPWGSPTAIGAASGCLAGLVGITPGAGMVSQMHAILIGALVIPACFAVSRNMHKMRVDDRLDCLPIHGVAGALGTLLTGIFASKAEGSPYDGAAYGNPVQLWKQLAGVLVTLAVTVVGTTLSFAIVRGIGKVAGLPVRVREEHENDLDRSVHGEYAYEHLEHMEASMSMSTHAGGGGGGGSRHSSVTAHFGGSGGQVPHVSPAATTAVVSTATGAGGAVLPAGVYRMPSLQESRHGADGGSMHNKSAAAAAAPSPPASSGVADAGTVHQRTKVSHGDVSTTPATNSCGSRAHKADLNAVDGVDPTIDPNDIIPTGLGLALGGLGRGGTSDDGRSGSVIDGEPTAKGGVARNRGARTSQEATQ